MTITIAVTAIAFYYSNPFSTIRRITCFKCKSVISLSTTSFNVFLGLHLSGPCTSQVMHIYPIVVYFLGTCTYWW